MVDSVIAQLDIARTALAEAKTIQETKKILDIASAAEIYAKRQQLGDEAISYATSIKVEALAQLGRMLLETPRNPGTRIIGGGTGAGSAVSLPPATPTLADLGLDKKTSKLAQDIAELPEEQLELVKAGVLTLAQAQKPHVAANSGENEWYTKPAIIEMARIVMGTIDLDPASTTEANEIVKATQHFTKETDGISKEWAIRKWLNPSVCNCGVQPNVLQWEYEKARDMLKVRWADMQDQNQGVLELPSETHDTTHNEAMHQMFTGIAEHGRLLLAKNRNSFSIFMVQGLRETICQAKTSKAARRPTGTGETLEGEEALRAKRERQSIQAHGLAGRQSQEESGENQSAIQLDYRDVENVPGGLGQQVCLLSSDWPISAGALHSFIASRMSRDGSGQYDSLLLKLQRKEGEPASDGMDAGQASICPNCRTTGFSGVFPSSVWLNPPYAQPIIGRFCDKIISEVKAGRVKQAMVLVNNATETLWFQSLMGIAKAICFPKGRDMFWYPGRVSAPLQGQAIIYAGGNTPKFAESCKSIGIVLWV